MSAKETPSARTLPNADPGNSPEQREGEKRSPDGPVFNPAQQAELERVQRLAPSKSGVVARAFSGRSKAAAIHSKCLQCCSYDVAEVRHCQVTGCALWPYRPYQRERGGSCK